MGTSDDTEVFLSLEDDPPLRSRQPVEVEDTSSTGVEVAADGLHWKPIFLTPRSSARPRLLHRELADPGHGLPRCATKAPVR